MIVHILLLILGLAILVKGADWLVDGAVSLAKTYHVSELAIGLTVVAFGTSAPELVVNIISSVQKYNDVTVGNIVGSNLFNLMLILGISGLVFPLTVQVKTVWREIPLSLLAAVLVLILANDTMMGKSANVIGRVDGLILLAFFAFFMYYIFRNLKIEPNPVDTGYKIFKPLTTFAYIIVGLACLVLGSKLIVDKAVIIAGLLGVSQKLIGLTIVSAGTSLPELVTSVVAAVKKNSDIAIGNIIGSNIFNIFFILGISATIYPISYNLKFNLDVWILVISTVLLFGAMFSGRKHKLDRWEAGILLVGYIAYVVYLIHMK